MDATLCNQYIDDLYDLAETLVDHDCDQFVWLEDSSIDKLSWWFEPPPDEEVEDKLVEVRDLLGRILTRFGIDPDRYVGTEEDNTGAAPQIVLNQQFSQNQNVEGRTTLTIEIQGLIEEFKSELAEAEPDPSRLSNLRERIVSQAPQAATTLIDLLIRRVANGIS